MTPHKRYKEENKSTQVNRNHKDDYNNKIEELITQSNFTNLPHDITNKQQRNIRSIINNSNNIINKTTNRNTVT